MSVVDKILFGAWLLGILILVAAPLLGGYVGAVLIHGVDTVRSQVVPWVTLIMAGVLVLWLIVSHVIELMLRAQRSPQSTFMREVLSSGASLLVLAVLYGLVFSDAIACLTAAGCAALLLLVCSPAVNVLEKRAPRRG